jgi:hypothetical protein
VRDDPSAGREDDPPFPQHRLERLPLEATVVLLAVELEQLAEREARRLLDARVQFDEGGVESRRERAADAALPCPPQSEKRHDGAALRPRPGGGEQSARARPEGLGDLREAHDGGVRLARLDLGEEALGQTGLDREPATAPPRSPARAADALSHIDQKSARRRSSTTGRIARDVRRPLAVLVGVLAVLVERRAATIDLIARIETIGRSSARMLVPV